MIPSSLRVLFLIPGEDCGSSMVFARRLFEHVKLRVEAADILYLRSRTKPIVIARQWWMLQQRLRDLRANVLHSQYGTMTGLLAGFSGSTVRVITYRGSDLNPVPCAPLRGSVGHCLSRVAAMRAEAIVCVSDQLKERLRWLPHSSEICVLPSGVDTSLFRPMDQGDVRRSLGWSPRQPVVLFNGSNPKVKRLDLAQSAVDVAKRMINSGVRFEVMNGRVDENVVPLMMNASDCLLMTSDYEGSPTVVQEAVACGLPVVSVDVGDVRRVLADVTPSAIVCRDPDCLGRAISEFLVNRCRTNGPSISQRFSFETIADCLIDIYNRALAVARRRNVKL